MLTLDERNLLKIVLDALDRLFDGHSTVTDVHALLVATAMAVRGGRFEAALERSSHQLEAIVRSHDLPDRKHDVALDATEELRKLVVEELDRDGKENPKGRHDIHRGRLGKSDDGNS